MNCGRRVIPALLLAVLIPGCTIERVYLGSELPTALQGKITVGSTTKGEILQILGPPATVRRQYDGDLFIYSYIQQNSSRIDIAEPVVTHLTVFSYSRVQQKDDSLVILFDKNGVVKSFGFHRGTKEMTPF